MKQFEYKIYRIARQSIWHNKIDYESVEKELNDLGKQGWEVVNGTNSNMYENKFTGVIIILKREKIN
jgi:Domain of unknown function (DUF4177)